MRLSLARSLSAGSLCVCPLPTAHPYSVCLSVCAAVQKVSLASELILLYSTSRSPLISAAEKDYIPTGNSVWSGRGVAHLISRRSGSGLGGRPDQIAAGGHDELTPTHTASCLLHVGTNSLDQLFVSRRDRLVAANASLKWLIYWKRKTLLNG